MTFKLITIGFLFLNIAFTTKTLATSGYSVPVIFGDIQKYKDVILKNPTHPFKMQNAVINFEMEGGRRQVSKKTKKRRRNKN